MTNKMHQIRFRLELTTLPSPDPLVRWGEGTPSPFSIPSTPLAPRPEPPLQHTATLTTDHIRNKLYDDPCI